MQNHTTTPIRCLYALLRIYKPGASLAPKTSPVAIVLGNGPSLKNDLPALLSLKEHHKVDFWCVNFFAETEYYEQLKPRFYVLADPGYWMATVSPNMQKRRNALFDTLKRKTAWPMTVYLPLRAKHSEILKQLTEIPLEVRFFNTHPVASTSNTLNFWAYRHLLGMPRPQNVLIGALYLAIVSRYKNVYLLGADHSWVRSIEVTQDNTVLINKGHFYDEQSPSSVRSQGNSNSWGISHLLHIFSIAFRQYEVLEQFSTNLGVKVINGSSFSLIDAFERQPIEFILASLSSPD